MSQFKRRATVGAVLTGCALLNLPSAVAVPVLGGTLDPLTIPKYVTPLVIPPVMRATGTEPDPEFDGTRDVYDIAVRQFQQQILPGGIWNTVNGRTDAFPATTIWSYGPAADSLPDSAALGGAAGVAPAPNSQFNYPAYTVENIKDRTTSIHWINDLTDNAWALDPNNKGNALPHLFAVDQSLHWANPVADCKGGELRTDCAGTTAEPYLGPVSMVTHLHGAHAASAGDGYTEAWWLPDASNINCIPREIDPVTGFASGAPIFPVDVNGDPIQGLQPDGTWNVVCEGTIANQLTNRQGAVVPNVNNLDPNAPGGLGQGQGVATFRYHNDQPSATLWYHDHSLGTTRLNVYAGPAGFYLVRDGVNPSGETGLTAGILPGPAPVAGEDLATTNFPAALGGSREKYREIPIVIQGRSFNTDGSLFYPDNRAFFEGLNVPGQPQQFPGAPELQIDLDPLTSDIAPIWNPEAFFNTMVVNGVTWPKLEVAPAQYRFRLLNGSNSRFINLALKITDALGNPITVDKTVWLPLGNGNFNPSTTKVDELNFFQIGAEQSLSPTVTAVSTGWASRLDGPNAINGLRKLTSTTPAPDPQQALLMGLAERADVIVDFRGLPDGTIITMTNTAPDAPFGGFPDVPADPATTGQVMRFVVNSAHLGDSLTDEIRDPVTGVVTNPLTAASNVEDLVVNPADLDNFTVAVTNPVARELALVEEESTKICVDVDVDGNWVQVAGIPVNGVCAIPTAFPMAPKAAVLGTVDPAGIPTVTLWSDPIVTNPNADGSGTQTAEQWNLWNFTVDGHPIHVHLVKFKVLGRSRIGGGSSVINTKDGTQAWENGWKDTVISYPGEITSISADFDINGLYVWHCHIVEHEDNEMMVPMCVGQASTPEITNPDGTITPAVVRDCPAQLF